MYLNRLHLQHRVMCMSHANHTKVTTFQVTFLKAQEPGPRPQHLLSFKWDNLCPNYVVSRPMIFRMKYTELRLQLYVEKVTTSNNMVLQYNRCADRLRIWEW